MASLNKNVANVSCYAEAISVLIDGHTTIRGLSEESGLAYNACRKFVATLRRRGLVHVGAWERDSIGRWTIAAFAWGSGKDAKRPPIQTSGQRGKTYRARVKARMTLGISRSPRDEMPEVRNMDASPRDSAST